MTKHLIPYLILSTFLVSCLGQSKEHIMPRLLAYLDSVTQNADTCRLSIRSFTDFEWDKLYIFYEYTSKDYIESFVNIRSDKIRSLEEGFGEFVFVNKNKVVYVEKFNRDESAIDIATPLDSTSFSKETKKYTEILPFLDKAQDSILVKKIASKENCPRCLIYEVIYVTDIGKESEMPW